MSTHLCPFWVEGLLGILHLCVLRAKNTKVLNFAIGLNRNSNLPTPLLDGDAGGRGGDGVCVLHVEYEFTKVSFSSLYSTLCSDPSQIPFPLLFQVFLQSHFILNPTPYSNTLPNQPHFHP